MRQKQDKRGRKKPQQGEAVLELPECEQSDTVHESIDLGGDLTQQAVKQNGIALTVYLGSIHAF